MTGIQLLKFIKNNARLVGVIAFVLVIGLVVAVSTVTHQRSKSAAAKLTLGPLPDLSDTSTQNISPTNNFKVSANWGIDWNYDCTSVSPQPGIFDVTIQDPDGTYSANADSLITNGVKGSGVQHESQAGTFQLAINADSGCTWHVQVVNNASPTTVSDEPKPSNNSGQSSQQNTSPAKFIVYPQGSNGTPSSDINDWINDGAAEVVNPADLKVYGEVKNTGGKSGTPSCNIQAHDDSYSYQGTDIVTRTSPLQPGGVWDWKDDITITSQGAGFVTKIEITCQNG